MTRSVFAGIDGGGTKTVVVLVDESGAELNRVQTSTSNAAIVGHDAAGEVLRSALIDALSGAGVESPISAAWFGLSGSDRPEDHRHLNPHLHDLATEIRMTNDAELILGALPDSVGVAIVSGTGSVAVGHNAQGARARSGGWGQIIGDEGSGYDFARRMFDAYSREVDGRGPGTTLTGRLMSHLSLTEPHQLIAYVYKSDTTKADLAKLAVIVVEEADVGDAVALDIIAASARELANTASAVARRLGFEMTLPLALTGGMLVHVDRFREQVLDGIRSNWPALESRIVLDPALAAAQAMASAPTSQVAH